MLLRKTKNSMPAMFMYPYGQGWVIVSSSYDDWGGYNQSGSAARAIIRDAIAWAEKPADLPIHLPGSSASLDLTVRNPGPVAAAQVKLLLMSPSRDRVMSEQTVPAAVPAGGSIEVPFSHAFLANTELGIYHIDYQLLDAAGETLQPVLEDDSGRIVVAQPPDTNSYRPPYIPFHLTTREFFAQARDHLTENGVVAINVGRTLTDWSLVEVLASTLKAVFPNVYTVDLAEPGYDLINVLVVATVQPTSVDNLRQNATLLTDPILREVAGDSVARVQEFTAPAMVLTDDRAPVEQVVHRLILSYVMGQ